MSMVAITISVVNRALIFKLIINKQLWSSKQEYQKNNNLVDCMALNISRHELSNDWVVLLIWLSREDISGWWFSG